MMKVNINKENLTADESLACIGWKSDENKIVDLVEIDLKDELEKDIYTRFFVHFNHGDRTPLHIYPLRINDNQCKDRKLSENTLSLKQKKILYSWAKDFLSENEMEIKNN